MDSIIIQNPKGLFKTQSTKVYPSNITFDNNDEEEKDIIKKVPGIE
jgi:hypothetical protein